MRPLSRGYEAALQAAVLARYDRSAAAAPSVVTTLRPLPSTPDLSVPDRGVPDRGVLDLGLVDLAMAG